MKEVLKDWKDILWEKMSKEDREKPSVFDKTPIEKIK
tara:strand:- start:1360 stop:1470 length:111 start_codon:yes stop_codon:yes gene_type:complete